MGVSVDVLRDVAAPGDKLTVAQLYNFSDFRFSNDPQYGNNYIAGIPPHVLRTTVTTRSASISHRLSIGCQQEHGSITPIRNGCQAMFYSAYRLA